MEGHQKNQRNGGTESHDLAGSPLLSLKQAHARAPVCARVRACGFKIKGAFTCVSTPSVSADLAVLSQ